MGSKLLLLVGTRKGAFIVEGDHRRTNWQVKGPFCDAWPINHVQYDPTTRAILAVGGNAWFGPSVWRTRDWGETWTQSSEGITYGDAGPKLETLWNIAPVNGSMYLGAAPAGLFKSQNGGESWTHVAGLRNHPTTPDWMPGNGGLCLHTIVPHPSDKQQLWVGISAVGVFHSADGGETWTPRNRGVRCDYSPDKYPEVGQCVHKMGIAAGTTDWLYQQNHCGVYRSRDAGLSWQEITNELPSTFGFPLGVHPRDPQTLFTIPLNGDSNGRFMPDAKAAVWRSRDGGDTWTRFAKGLPQEQAYMGVLREAMAVDKLEPAGVYFGANNGQLFASADEGESWQVVANYLPTITSVEAALVEG